METKQPPKDLLLIKQAVDEEILPCLREKNYFEAKAVVDNILYVVDHTRIQMEHCGMSYWQFLKYWLRIWREASMNRLILSKKESGLIWPKA